MSLADEIKQLGENPHCCASGEWYDGQPAEVRQAFDDYIAAGKSRGALHRLLLEKGLKHSRSQFLEHLRNHVPRG
jgi:hypothetical protein